ARARRRRGAPAGELSRAAGRTLPLRRCRRRRRRPRRRRRLLAQVGLDEHVDVAVEDGVGVADLGVRAVVLHHAVGLEHVGAALVAEADIFLALADLGNLLLLSMIPEIYEVCL